MASTPTGLNDILYGSADAETIRARGGNDRVWGLGGDDYLYGQAGNDLLFGGGGHDTLDGGAGNDRLVGGNGLDSLFGGDGDDVLIGGKHSDYYIGGAGADLFVFVPGDVTHHDAWSNAVLDFSQPQGDRFDISALAALGTSDAPFTFIGTGAFTGGNQVRFVTDGLVTIVEVAIAGVGSAGGDFFFFEVHGTPALTAADFVL